MIVKLDLAFKFEAYLHSQALPNKRQKVGVINYEGANCILNK